MWQIYPLKDVYLGWHLLLTRSKCVAYLGLGAGHPRKASEVTQAAAHTFHHLKRV
jgi:hypothetical protein